MTGAAQLTRHFFARNTVAVARALLGQRLVRVSDGQRLSGLICETEAYGGQEDQASHARHRTSRSAIMYGPPGYAYVYFIYGMYFCLNAVTEPDGCPGAVLIRAIFPEEGLRVMQACRRGAPIARLTDGPAKLCQALAITRAFNGTELTASSELFIERSPMVSGSEVAATPRIGVRGDQVALTRLWRFLWQPVPRPVAI